MTSQVAVFNSLGVAIASDTVTTHTGESGVSKTTSGSEKMWPLGGDHLIVALGSGNVYQNDVNTRILVGEWSRDLANPLETLPDYANSFTEWLNVEPAMITRDSEIGVVHRCLNDHYYYVRKRLDWWAEGQDDFTDEEAQKALTQRVNDGLEWLQGLDAYTGTSDEHEKEVIRDLEINVAEKVDYIFDGYPLTPESREVLLASAPLILSRVQTMPGTPNSP